MARVVESELRSAMRYVIEEARGRLEFVDIRREFLGRTVNVTFIYSHREWSCSVARHWIEACPRGLFSFAAWHRVFVQLLGEYYGTQRRMLMPMPTVIFDLVDTLYEPVPLTPADEAINLAVNSMRDQIEREANAALMFGLGGQTNNIEPPVAERGLTIERMMEAVRVLRDAPARWFARPRAPEVRLPDPQAGAQLTIDNRGDYAVTIHGGAGFTLELAPGQAWQQPAGRYISVTDGLSDVYVLPEDFLPGETASIHNGQPHHLSVRRANGAFLAHLAPGAVMSFICTAPGHFHNMDAPPSRSARRTPAAVDKSIELLRSWLTPAQLAQFEKHRSFHVVGHKTGSRYRIRYADKSFNVEREDGGRLCFVPKDPNIWAPGDIMLAQKLALEFDEEAALAVANSDGGLFVRAVLGTEYHASDFADRN